MQNTSITNGKPARFLVLLLCAVLLIGIFPGSAFAWPSGTKATSWYGSTVTGSDGKAYVHPTNWHYMVYHSDGTTSYSSWAGGSVYEHFMLTDDAGASRWVYCIESGVRFGDGSYSGSGSNTNYMNLLPASAQYGIKVASLYGWHPGATLPVSGINAEDWYMATQVILWEYQQQLRSDALSRHANGSVGANQFYSIIKDRPAEKAYDWILGKIAQHGTLPSFTKGTAASAPVHELKWDTKDKVYRLTLTDTNNLNIDFERLAGSGVSVTRSGNKYTFTSEKMIVDPVTFQYRKNIAIAEKMIVWGRPDNQTMMTGAEDPITFFMKVKTETYGKGRFIKSSEDGIVEGIQFTVSGTDILGNKVSETVTTGKNGQVEKDFLPGTYLVTEKPIDRYVTPAPKYITIESGQVSEVSFHNVLKKFRVQLTKSDADTGTAQGDASLAGAVYGIYRNGQLIDTYTTDAKGSFLTRYYVCGTDWQVREITPSEGYLLDAAVHSVGADPKLYTVEYNLTENRVTEKVIYGNVRLIKHTDDPDPDVAENEHSKDGNKGEIEMPEQGAQFQLYLKSAGSYEAAKTSERDLLTTDADGFATSKMLPYGRYTVHQIKGLEGKAFIPDFTVYVSRNGFTYSYILKNDQITGRVRIEKRDIETGKIIPLEGAGFKVKDLKTGEFIVQRIWYPKPVDLDTFYTSDEGYLMLPDELPMGDYELVEVAAPYGYVLDSSPVAFKIDGTDAVVTVVRHNIAQKASIIITKTGEVYSSVSESGGIYSPVYDVMGLPGAVYNIIADEDIYTPDGTLRIAKDEIAQTITTADDAKAQADPLYLGRYRVEEVTAPVGMVRNTEPDIVTLTYAGQEVEVYDTSLDLYDERQKVDLSLEKTLEMDALFGIGMNDEYKSVTFGLFAAFDIPALDGSFIPKDGLIETVQITPGEDEAGIYTASFLSDLPFGSYYIRELETHKAYVRNDNIYPVVFAYEGQDKATVKISANNGEAVENELLRGSVKGMKTGEDGTPLEGALFGLFRPDDKALNEDTALLTVTTAEDGTFEFADIPFGHYIVREITAPTGYTVNTDYHHIYVGTDGQVIEISLENKLIRGSVQILKAEIISSSDGALMRRLPGAVFELYADTDGDGEFTEADKLTCEFEETDAGLHEVANILYGGYFAKEKSAPSGYIIDEKPYFFEITEDGQVAVIENGTKGNGFTNKPFTGNLKIIKDSEDGRKDGFAFEVRSEDGTYRKTFTTDDTGVIEIKDLRIGSYTVSEIENRASRGYIIPDSVNVAIRTDETVTVRFYNELQKVPVTEKQSYDAGKPVPQTSDDGLILLWAAALLSGLALSIIFAVRLSRSKSKAGKGRRATITVLAICIAGVTLGAYMLVSEYSEYRGSIGVYSEISDDAFPPDGGDQSGQQTDIAVSQVVDFDALRAVNPDIVGWLVSEDEAVNYPIVQTDDNGFYLKHMFDKQKNKTGCPFLDFENAMNFTDGNSVVYGHNMLDGSMFGSLKKNMEQEYFDTHPQMNLYTPAANYSVDIFSVYTANPAESADTKTSPWRLSWDNEAEYMGWLTQIKARSLIESDIEIADGNKVLTLSTCTNGGKSRLLVVGRLKEIS